MDLTTFQHKIGIGDTNNNGSSKKLVVLDVVDRLSSLPTELLIYLLSFLPTKDAAAMCTLSRTLHCVFPLLTTLDFDATHIHHCSNNPSAINHFPAFVTFVDAVLRASHSHHLTKFRLRVGLPHATRHSRRCFPYPSYQHDNCFPDLDPSRLNAWISFPLTRCGLTELDIRILINQSGSVQLPPEIFTCETLEVLKLDVNLGFDPHSTFRLPNLKVCHLSAFLISEDDFLTRLVSSCPLLEDFALEAYWNHVHCVSISSPSLRRLHLKLLRLDPEAKDIADFVLINAPNLEYIYYYDNLAKQYSVQNMPALVKAVVYIREMFTLAPFETYHQQVFNLIKPLSNVEHLSLLGLCTKALHFADADVKDHNLPLFTNLKCLELGFFIDSHWDKVMLALLNRCPMLETLVFPNGLACASKTPMKASLLEWEERFFRGAQTSVPQVHLKRIVIKKFYGSERELYMIQFLLRQAYVLEELVIVRFLRTSYPVPDAVSAQTTLNMLPRASKTCSIQVK